MEMIKKGATVKFIIPGKRHLPEEELDACQLEYQNIGKCTPLKTKMTMETQAREDVSPIQNGDFPASHVRLLGGTM